MGTTTRPTTGPRRRRAVAAVVLGAWLIAACSSGGDGDQAASTTAPAATEADQVLELAGNDLVATVDPRYQSYNVEMVEVTGGEFWKPYDAGSGKVVRDPIDLASPRLRNLAGALGPVYIRVSGTWANSTWFDPDGTAGDTAPEGFKGVLTGDQWKGVGAFAKALDAKIVTSFAVSDGTRDANGVWQPDQARKLLEFSKANDIPIYAAEFFNEPSLPLGVPAGYDADAYARDFAVFKALVDEVMPEMKIAGPGTTGEVRHLVIAPSIPSEQILQRVGADLEIFSSHFYPKVSARCSSEEGPEVALSDDYLSRISDDQAFYVKLRDTYVPGAPMWLTETAQAACGGDRWAATNRDLVRYVDTLGRYANGNGNAVFHNTLAASDYGLLDEDGLAPRPDYWAAVLWARLMGNRILAAKTPTDPIGLSVYASCAATGADAPGGVTYAVVNPSATETRTVATATGETRAYVLAGADLDGTVPALNGVDLAAHEDGTLPALDPVTGTAPVALPPASVAFIVDPPAHPTCS